MSEVLRSNPGTVESAPNSAGVEGGADIGVSIVREVTESLPNMPSENAPADANNSKKSSQATKKQIQASARYKRRVAALKAAKPPAKQMIKDIQSMIHSQLVDLSKKQSRYKSKGPKGYYEYNKVISQMRGLKRVLSSLLYRTYEDLKSLWLKVVHNIV